MSDDRLRSLERAARVDPTDGAAGQALARAYELAGERRRAHLEHARLARAGSAAARATLDAWAPRPHAAAAIARRASLGPRVGRRVVPLPGSVIAARAVASDDRLLLPTRTRLVALDPGDLSEVWSAPGQAWPVALRGDDVLHPGGPGLILRSGADGALLSELPLAGRVVELFVWADRAVVVHDAPSVRRVSALDVGANPGRVLWTHTWPTGVVDLVRPARHRVVLAGPRRVEAVELESGRTVAGRTLLPSHPRGRRWEGAQTADARGVVVVTVGADSTSTGAEVDIAEHDLARLEPRWRITERAHDLGVALGDGVVALLLRRAEETTFIAVDRATGATNRPAAPPPDLRLMWVDGAAYALEARADVTTSTAVSVHDSRSLERRARHELPSTGPDLVDVDGVPFAGAFVAVFAHRDRTALVRLADEP